MIKKVVINDGFGAFALSVEGVRCLCEKYGFDPKDFELGKFGTVKSPFDYKWRTKPCLIQTIEALGQAASASGVSCLKVKEIEVGDDQHLLIRGNPRGERLYAVDGPGPDDYTWSDLTPSRTLGEDKAKTTDTSVDPKGTMDREDDNDMPFKDYD
jgi:hypothetical protein